MGGQNLEAIFGEVHFFHLFDSIYKETERACIYNALRGAMQWKKRGSGWKTSGIFCMALAYLFSGMLDPTYNFYCDFPLSSSLCVPDHYSSQSGSPLLTNHASTASERMNNVKSDYAMHF